jgi:transcriptional regulator with XRE-family HTH domain
LLRARRRRDWSQAELARRAGIPASQLCAYETSAKQPTAATLARLLAVAGASLGLADERLERLRQGAELVDVLGLLEVVPLRAAGPLLAPPFRDLVA